MSPRDLLLASIDQNDLPGLTQLLSAPLPPPSINFQSDTHVGATPLTLACQLGHVDVVKALLGVENADVNLQDTQGNTPLHCACVRAHVEIVSLLLKDPRVDVNPLNQRAATPLILASQLGLESVVSLLLRHHQLSVSKRASGGATALSLACEEGHPGVVGLLLNDHRVDVNRQRTDGTTPLWNAANKGHVVIVKMILASKWPIDTKARSTTPERTSAAEVARGKNQKPQAAMFARELTPQSRQRNGFSEIAEVIEAYQEDPQKIRAQLRAQLGEGLAGELFSLVVFHTDGFLQPKSAEPLPQEEEVKEPNPPKGADSEAALRYFNIAKELPMDLQMLLCNRTYGVSRGIVKKKNSEAGFKKFGKILAKEKVAKEEEPEETNVAEGNV